MTDLDDLFIIVRIIFIGKTISCSVTKESWQKKSLIVEILFFPFVFIVFILNQKKKSVVKRYLPKGFQPHICSQNALFHLI